MCIFERPPKAAGVDYSLKHVVKEELGGVQLRRGGGDGGGGGLPGENSCRYTASSKSMLPRATISHICSHGRRKPENKDRKKMWYLTVARRKKASRWARAGVGHGAKWAAGPGNSLSLPALLSPYPSEPLSEDSGGGREQLPSFVL